MTIVSTLENIEISLSERIEELFPLVTALKKCLSEKERLEHLAHFSEVQNVLASSSLLKNIFNHLDAVQKRIFLSLIAIKQIDVVCCGAMENYSSHTYWATFLDRLYAVEKFYYEMGGIVGYHFSMLECLEQKHKESNFPNLQFDRAPGIDIRNPNQEVLGYIRKGIEELPKMAEVYPVGGAADRLRLFDELTGIALPAARLVFRGKTLIEGLIADLQAREFLYYKLTGKNICVPIALMTSHEKNNHEHIIRIFEENSWFGRPFQTIRFFCQSLVPTINEQGNWAMIDPLEPLMKPGGHGVIWKLAKDEGVFSWLKENGISKALIRQINNPIAGIDYGLLGFCGIGFSLNKVFGFASCERQVHASEGMNVLCERKLGDDYEYVLTNVEYCNFSKWKITDQPAAKNSMFSKFSSNTNILFADIDAIENAILENPIPGMLVNLKKCAVKNSCGELVEQNVARLESTMQNIADSFSKKMTTSLSSPEINDFSSYLTYNDRHKTISAVKKDPLGKESLLETPEGCYYDVQLNARDLLENYCGFDVPPSKILSWSESFVFDYCPSLGPLYSIIAQKMRKGKLAQGSELKLEISELDLENLTLDGSLLILSDAIMGHKNPDDSALIYSQLNSKCRLKNVKVVNRGVDWSVHNIPWKGQLQRREACVIAIQGDGEFDAEDVEFLGDFYIEVLAGTKVSVRQNKGVLYWTQENIHQSTWSWCYRFDEQNNIILEK